MIEYQRLILRDAVRNDAFRAALRAVIKTGETVVADIGSGTGYLSFLASQLGAKECYLYELSNLLGLSRAIARKSGITNCHFIQKHSTQVRDPVRADVVVSETLGNYALEENILETLRDARRFLKPGSVMIPQSLEQFVSPVVSDRIHAELDIWSGLGEGMDFSPAREVCLNNIFVRAVRPADLPPGAGMTQRWDTVDFRLENDSVRKATVRWKFEAAMPVYGFALWWDCLLAPGVSLSTSPTAPAAHWEQIYLPLLMTLHPDAGESIELRLRSDTRYEVKVHLTWEAVLIGHDGKQRAKVSMDMRRGHIE